MPSFNKSAAGEQDQKVLAVASQPVGVLSLCLSELHGETIFSVILQKVTVNGSHNYIWYN